MHIHAHIKPFLLILAIVCFLHEVNRQLINIGITVHCDVVLNQLQLTKAPSLQTQRIKPAITSMTIVRWLKRITKAVFFFFTLFDNTVVHHVIT